MGDGGQGNTAKSFSCFWNHSHIQCCRLHLPAGRCHLPKNVSIQRCLYFSRMLKKVAQSICYVNDTILHFSTKYWPNHYTASKCLLLFHNWPWYHHLSSIMIRTHTLYHTSYSGKNKTHWKGWNSSIDIWSNY